MELGILTETLNAFIGAFSGGFDRLRPAVNGLLRIFISLDVLFFCLMVLFEVENLRNGFRKLLVLSLWTYVIQDFDAHATSVVNSLIGAGLMAAGRGGADPHVLLDPSRILEGSFEATAPLANNLLNAGVLDLMDIVTFGFSYIFVMLAFGALALNAFLAIIEYYLALAVAGILMPFGLLQPTRWLAMKPVSFLVASGIKLMVIAFIMAISGEVLGRIRFAGEEPTLREIWVMMFTSGTLAMVAWIAPQRFASGFMAGAASLGGSDAVGVAIPAAMGAAALASPLTVAGQAVGAWASRGLSGVTSALAARGSSATRGSGSSGPGGGGAPGGAPRASSTLVASASAASSSAATRPELVSGHSHKS